MKDHSVFRQEVLSQRTLDALRCQGFPGSIQMLRAENQFQLEGGNLGAFTVLAHGAFLGSLTNGVVLLGMILKL